MDLRPWNYWTRDGQPYAETRRDPGGARTGAGENPNHPGALHYWVHLWEPTDTPERAEAEADRLLTLMPGAGHIVHMPAHIYMRVGRHADVVVVEPAGGEGRRGLHRAVPRAGALPAGLLPAQHPLHLDGGDGHGPEAARARRGAQGVGGDSRRGARHHPDSPGLRRRAVLGDGAVRPVERHPGRQGTALRLAVHPRRVALRARHGADGDRAPRRCRDGTRAIEGASSKTPR